jgi:putative glycosyltransferase (TIGR04372 family)
VGTSESCAVALESCDMSQQTQNELNDRTSGLQKFLERQWEQLRNGGWPIVKLKFQLFGRRIKYRVYLFIIFPVFIIPVIFLRLIRPWFLIRLGEFESESIGHFSAPVEIFLSEVDCGFHALGQRGVDLWYLNKVVANDVLRKKWAHFFRIGPSQILKPMDRLNRFIPGGKAHEVPWRPLSDRTRPWQFCDIHDVLLRTKPHLAFSEDEEVEGLRVLNKMGIEKNDPFICFVARDGAYHNEFHKRYDHRNSSIQLLIPATEKLIDLDYKAVRMGAKVNEPLQTTNPSIVDYSTNGMRTEMLDLFIISRCKFILSTGTGLDALAPTFRLPVVFVNCPQFGDFDRMDKSVLFIPKHFWSIDEKRMLTFPEIFKLGAHLYTLQLQFQMAKIELIDNTPEEIIDVTLEMHQRLSGTWVDNSDDEGLQNKLRAIWPLRPEGLPLQARMGASFLRMYPNLLG